ncbi:hypothetical protein POM88_047271 [Heracleum sosnowskyi]|uniref:Uncharacterized protein n=1 Tax=Heracleum sosnowskyi TaxID=360622 RepID=A0AAD8LXE1_9APIA|nr:hypothetical protein POM88_047271 [Heracleum sosnowskyi]
MASSQVASPQVEEVISSNAEEQKVMTPPAQNFDIDKPVHLIEEDEDVIEEEDDDGIEIIPRRDEGKQVENLDDATDEEEEDIGVKPASQFYDEEEDEDQEPIEKGIRTRRFPDEDDDE